MGVATTATDLFIGLLLYLLLFSASAQVAEWSSVVFDKDLVWVRFSPYVRHDDSRFSYSEPDLAAMISTVAPTFRKLLVPNIERALFMNSSSSYSTALIPKAAANYNNANKNNKNNNNNSDSEFRPLQLMLTFDLFGSSKFVDLPLVYNISTEANRVHAGTVTTLCILESSYIGRSPMEIKATLRRIRRLLEVANKDTGFNYTLASFFHGNGCDEEQDSEFGAKLRVIAPHADVIYFKQIPHPSDRELQEGPLPTFNLTQNTFQYCSLIVNNNKGVAVGGAEEEKIPEMGILTGWPTLRSNESSPESERQALVTYWSAMATLAGAWNTQVILWQAFDTYSEDAGWLTRTGWWKLDNPESGRAADFVFRSKAELLDGIVGVGARPAEGTTNWVVMACAVVGIVLVAAAGGAVLQRVVAGRRNPLDKEEIINFFQGTEPVGEGDDECEDDYANARSNQLPYDTELEVASEDFLAEKLLGSGEFGVVHKGAIVKLGERVEVAIKTTKPRSPSEAVIALMEEIKIMSWIGEHPNIVAIVGAHTAELESRGKVFLFIELCGLGALREFLRSNRASYLALSQAVAEEDVIDRAQAQEGCGLGASDLRKWTLEIASGMEFLSCKKVVHGDLATRNVLLTADKVARISDFGLSRRMASSKDYARLSGEDKMPWKWMSPEGLRDFGKLTQKSDVWAYGVTIWEIYSLGQGPYGGMCWTDDFASRLEQGMRLEKPVADVENVYTELMLNCWEANPGNRPTFSEIREQLGGTRDADYVQFGGEYTSIAECVSGNNPPEESEGEIKI